MGTEAKHAYRFGYLKSEQWQNVRAGVLARDKCRCQVCGYESFFNDAHHVHYAPSFWSTEVKDVVVLCRPCHELVHALIPKFGQKANQSRKRFDAAVAVLQDWLKKHEALVTRNQIIKPDCRFCRQPMDSVELRNVHGVRSGDSIDADWPICGPCWDKMNIAFPAPRSWKQIRAFKEKTHLLTNVT